MKLWHLAALVALFGLGAIYQGQGVTSATGILPIQRPAVAGDPVVSTAPLGPPVRARQAASSPGNAPRDFHLRVIDRLDGRPLAGVALRVGTEQGTVAGQTDEHGSTVFSGTATWALATMDGYRRQRLDLDPANREPMIELAPVTRVTVRVIDGQGRPVEGMRVLYSIAGPDEVQTTFGITDAAGVTARSNVPQGARIWLSAFGVGQELFTDPRVADHECMLELPSTAVLVGRVIDSSGVGLADQLVSADPDDPDEDDIVCRTAEGGGFRMRDVPAGGIRLDVPGTPCTAVRVFVTKPVELAVPDLQVAPSALTSGRVLCPDGAQAEGLEVTLWRESTRLARGTTDAEGRFTLDGWVGEAQVRVAHPGSPLPLLEVSVDLPQSSLELRVDPGRSLIVQVENGDPGSRLDCLILGGQVQAPVVLGRTTRTLQQGQIQLPWPPESKWILVLAGEAMGAFAALPSSEAGLSLVLGVARVRPGPRLLAQGAAHLVLRSAAGSHVECELGEGRAPLTFPPGPTRWHALNGEHAPIASGRVVLEQGKAAILESDHAPCSIVGRLSDGQERTSARLSWLDGMAYMEAPLTSDGAFQFHDLAPGRYSLGLAPMGSIRIDLQPGEERQLVCKEVAYRPVTVLENGSPAAGLQRVTAYLSSDEGRTLRKLDLDVQGSTVQIPIGDERVLFLAELGTAKELRRAFATFSSANLAEGAIHLGTESIYLAQPTALPRAPQLRIRGLSGSPWPAMGAEKIPMRWKGGRWEFSGLVPDSMVEVLPGSLGVECSGRVQVL